jgi:hypothetical protein
MFWAMFVRVKESTLNQFKGTIIEELTKADPPASTPTSLVSP